MGESRMFVFHSLCGRLCVIESSFENFALFISRTSPKTSSAKLHSFFFVLQAPPSTSPALHLIQVCILPGVRQFVPFCRQHGLRQSPLRRRGSSPRIRLNHNDRPTSAIPPTEMVSRKLQCHHSPHRLHPRRTLRRRNPPPRNFRLRNRHLNSLETYLHAEPPIQRTADFHRA